MACKLKFLGGILTCCIAVFAVTSPTAMAIEGELTASEYPVRFDGEAIPGELNRYTGLFGIEIGCEQIVGEGELTESATEGTVSLTGIGCTAGQRAVTITTNECKYLVHDATGEGDEWPFKADLDCPPGKKVEVHFYNPKEENGVWCTLTIEGGAGQNKNLVGFKAINETSTGSLRIEGTLEGIKTQAHGICSAGLTINFNAAIDAKATIQGTNIFGVTIPIDIG
jgi:hypothetical protein